MDKELLKRHFDEAVQNGDQDRAIVYGTDLADMDEQIHVMLGYKQLQEADPVNNYRSALLYASLALKVSKICRGSASLQSSSWSMNVNETASAANAVDMYDNPTYDEYWDYLVHENICWNIIAAEHTSGSERDEYLDTARELMNTEVRHSGSWIDEYRDFLRAHWVNY